jgi:hypothetical protein
MLDSALIRDDNYPAARRIAICSAILFWRAPPLMATARPLSVNINTIILLSAAFIKCSRLTPLAIGDKN